MNYFQAIVHRANELDNLGLNYLKDLPFMSNDSILELLYDKACKMFNECNEDWDKIPDWAATLLDNGILYGSFRSGSLYKTLGFSVVSNDAHLRNLLERVEGRTDKELDFEIIADKKIVESLSD